MQLFYKLIYNPIINFLLRSLIFPFRNYLPHKFLLPPSGIVSFQLLNGRKIRMHTNQTSFVTWNIYWKGYRNYEYVPIFEALSKDVKTFLDVGSNIGLYSLILAGTNPSSKIWAFEPSQGPDKYLGLNVKENGFFENITTENIALADHNGFSEFVSAHSPKYSYLKEATLGGSGHLMGARENTSKKHFAVKTLTLDDYVKLNNIKSIDLIKLDTEETEHLIIREGLNSLRKFEPIIICEVFSKDMAAHLNDLLIPLGYLPYQSKNDHLLKIDEVLFNSGKILDCFFVTPSKLHLIADYIRN